MKIVTLNPAVAVVGKPPLIFAAFGHRALNGLEREFHTLGVCIVPLDLPRATERRFVIGLRRPVSARSWPSHGFSRQHAGAPASGSSREASTPTLTRIGTMNLTAIGAPISDPARCGFGSAESRRVGDRRSGSLKAMVATACLGFAFCSSTFAAEPVLSLPASDTTLHLAIPVPGGQSIDSQRTYRLVETGQHSQPVPVDLVPALADDGTAAKSWRLAANVPPNMGAGATRRFQLESTKAKSLAAFRFADVSDKSLSLWEGRRPVLVYNHGVLSKDGVPTNFNRSTYVHPLYGLDGEVLTDDFPKDHYHHRGLCWAWPHVTIEGKETDLWACKGIYQRFERWLFKEAGAASATLGVENGWYVDDKKVVQERVWLRVHPATRDEWAMDVELTWIPLGQPVTLMGAPGKSYGGLTLRYAPRTNTVITTTLGNDNKDLAITHLPWADLSAQFQGAPQPSGAALFIAPDHPDYPPEWLTRHYGILCIGWPGVNAQTFPPGNPIRCRYRVWIHRGAPDQAAVERAYAGYTAGEKVRWE